MSRIAPTGISAVRPRVTSELHHDGKPRSDDRGRTRWTDVSRNPEVPSIQQLRSRFQPNDVPKTAPASLGNRAATAGVSDVPEIRLNVATEQQSSRKRTNPEDSIHMEDPEKYFESTNHTQRFQQTRALFAKMEEQTRLDQERRRQSPIYRSKSPTRFPTTSRSSLVISPAVGTGDAKPTQRPSTSSSDPDRQAPAAKFTRYGVREPRVERPRVLSASASTDVREVNMVESSRSLDRDRSSSVDRLDEDASYEPSSLRDSSKSFSRSETDLARSDRESMPSAKLLKQHYEDVVRRNAAMFGGQVQRRRTRPVENHVQSGPDSLHKDEVNKPPVADRKPLFSNSRSDAEIIPTGSSRIRQNYTDHVSAPPKVMPTSAKVTSRYGRVEETTSTNLVSETPSQSANAVSSKPVVSNKDHVSRPARRTAEMDVEDDSVVKSIEAWKTRRRSTKYDEQQKEDEEQTSDEKPSVITDRDLNVGNGTDAGRTSPVESVHQSESAEASVSEPSLIFGVALRSRASESDDKEVKPHSEIETKVPVVSSSSEQTSVPRAEVDLPGELVQPERQTFSDFLPDDVDSDRNVELDAASSSARRRTSVELAEVPHFPKDSVLLTGGHPSTSPRSSFDGSHHLVSGELKPDDQIEDSVFTKGHTVTEHLGPQLNNLASTLPESGGEDVQSVDYLLASEASR